MKQLFTLLFVLISFLTQSQNTEKPTIRINCCQQNPPPNYVIKTEKKEYITDSIPKSLKTYWIEKIEVLKNEEQKKVFGNDNGVVIIYPKKEYLDSIHELNKSIKQITQLKR